MLMGRRVENHLRAILLKDIFQAFAAADVGDHGFQAGRGDRPMLGLEIGDRPPQLLLDQKDGILSLAQQNDFAGMGPQHLATDLTANGAASPGDQNALAPNEAMHLLHIGLNRLAPE